jgi:hypothetical protein
LPRHTFIAARPRRGSLSSGGFGHDVNGGTPCRPAGTAPNRFPAVQANVNQTASAGTGAGLPVDATFFSASRVRNRLI